MNSKKLVSFAATGVVAAALGSAAFLPQAAAQVPNGRFGQVQYAAVNPNREKPEKSPNLRMAMRALERAKDALQRADHDSAGHREQALDLVNRAIEQTRLAIRSDR